MNQIELLQAAADLAAHIKQHYPEAKKDEVAAMLALALFTAHETQTPMLLMEQVVNPRR